MFLIVLVNGNGDIVLVFGLRVISCVDVDLENVVEMRRISLFSG